MDYSHLNDEQREAVYTTDGPLMVLAGAGTGKALLNGTNILTRGGYLPIEKVNVGTKIFGSDGNTHKVLGVYPQGRKKINIIKFIDGTEIKCCEEHLWTVASDDNEELKTYTTKKLRSKLEKGEKLYVPTPYPFQLPEQPVPIDPYTFGLILATAKFTSKGVRFFIRTEELKAIIEEKFNAIGFKLKFIDKIVYKAESIDGSTTMEKFLSEFKFYEDKYIPRVYKINNVPVRRNLLIGFIDAIGINKGSYYKINTTTRLMNDLQFVAQTLGFLAKAKSSAITKHVDGKSIRKEINEVTIYPNRKFINALHTIPSKTLEGEFEIQKKYITAIKETSTFGKMTCIKVDAPDHLFVTDYCTLTHNTTVLVNKVAHLIEKGVDPKRILMLTFTNKAADEMTERINRLLGTESVEVWGGTYHSFCAELLRRNAQLIGFKPSFTICDTADSGEIINLIKERIGYKKEENLPTGKVIFGIFSYCINKGKDIEYAITNKFPQYLGKEAQLEKIRQNYIKYKAENNVLDYDDLLIQTNRLLEENVDLCRKISNFYQYILVDEYQDSNELQMRFLMHLRQFDNKNLCVVGDPEQCVLKGTQVKTTTGYKNVEDLTLDDKILSASGRGGLLYSQIAAINKNVVNADVVTVKTKSGIEIKTTPDHVFFVDTTTKDKFYIYLLENSKIGFKLGIYNTNIKNYESSYRIVCDRENGEKLWVIDTFDDLNKAQLKLEKYETLMKISSEKFSNTECFENQDKKAVLDFMVDNHIYYEYPTYVKSFNDGSVFKVNYTLFGDTWIGAKRKFYKSLIVADSLNEEAVKILADELDVSVCNRHQKGQRDRFIVKKIGIPSALSTSFKTFKKLKGLENVNTVFIEDAFITETKSSFLPASLIRPGMLVNVFDGKKIIKEEVVETSRQFEEEVEIYDINIDKLHNFFANNICVHNCIYGFRGSRYQNILEFPDSFEGCKIIKLFKNYRCNQEILDLSNEITSGSGVFENKLQSDKHAGKKPLIVEVDTQQAEADYVIRKIQQYLRDGYEPGDIAILSRGSNDSSAIEARITGVADYNKYGGIRFWERESTKNVLSFLKVLNNYQDEISWFRILKLYPSIGSVNAKKITEGVVNNGVDELINIKFIKKQFFDYLQELHDEFLKMQSMDLTEKIDYLINEYYQKIMKRGINARKVKDTTKRQELSGLYEDIERLQTLIEISKGYRSLNAYINDLLLDTTTSNFKENAITISTIHSAKGLEWPVVFILDCIDGKFPSDKGTSAYTEEALQEHQEELAEEKRSFYVALTRCADDLYLMYPKYNLYTHQENDLSPYLSEDNLYKEKCETIKAGGYHSYY